MLSAVLVIDDQHLAGVLTEIASFSNQFGIREVVDAKGDLARAVDNAHADVVLLELTELDRDLQKAGAIRKHWPDMAVVGLTSRDLQFAAEGRVGSELGSVAVWPFGTEDLERAIKSAVHQLHGGISANLVALLPGKAGSGASTIALHAARLAASELNRRVLVIEADLHSGLLSALLNVEPRISIREALTLAPPMNEYHWKRCVTSMGGVDFLLTRISVKEPIPVWTHYYHVLTYVLPRYDLIFVDLPEVVNSATAELVQRAGEVFVVSTPETGALNLSRQRRRELCEWNVDRARIRLLLNRWHKGDMGPPAAAQITGCSVAFSFPNDYGALQQAGKAGAPVSKGSALGEAYLAFSRMLLGMEAAPEQKTLRRRLRE